MMPTGRRAAGVLAGGLALVLAAALAPAGVNGRPVPAWSWAVWAAVFACALRVFGRAGLPFPEALRRVGWLAPVVAVFAVPAALLAPLGARGPVAAALFCRALAATSMGAAVAAWLGPSGIVAGARHLHMPVRLADVLESTLVSLAVVLRQVRAMLRAREARRPGFGAWSDLVSRPVDTVRGFGRLVASLLLRALERAEALEQARRARGGEA
jgi:energy-coupling factor transporter transmembrane protein EcfT